MSKPKLIFGDDNGSCSLWDITLAERDNYLLRMDDLEYGDASKDLSEKELKQQLEKLENEFYSHRIKIDTDENGYVPDYVEYLATVFGLETDSN